MHTGIKFILSSFMCTVCFEAEWSVDFFIIFLKDKGLHSLFALGLPRLPAQNRPGVCEALRVFPVQTFVSNTVSVSCPMNSEHADVILSDLRANLVRQYSNYNFQSQISGPKSKYSPPKLKLKRKSVFLAITWTGQLSDDVNGKNPQANETKPVNPFLHGDNVTTRWRFEGRRRPKNLGWAPKCASFSNKSTVLWFWMNAKFVPKWFRSCMHLLSYAYHENHYTHCWQRPGFTSAVRIYHLKPHHTSVIPIHELKLLVHRFTHDQYLPLSLQ